MQLLGKSDERDQLRWTLLWFIVFCGGQFLGFVAVLAVDPAKLDPCDGNVRDVRDLQLLIALAAIAIPLAFGALRFRGLQLILIVLLELGAVGGWLLLLGGPTECVPGYVQ